MNQARIHNLIERAVATFALDLTGLVVLTEAATGYYMLTPIIAALAGADQVLALTRDSRYGSAGEVRDEMMRWAQRWNVADRIEVLLSRESELFRKVDVVTNLGFVRPLDGPFLKRLGPTATVPLMWETWEYRPEDLDLAECRRLGIPVLGTNEHHPDLRIFEYIGHIGLKLLFHLDIEVFRSKVVVVGSGEFAEQTLAALRAAGAEATLIITEREGALTSDEARQALRNADALVVVEHHERRTLIGRGGEIDGAELCTLNPALAVAHICGGVERGELASVGFRCYPERFAAPGYMSVATDYLGPRPLIDLHVAGLKVGERMARARRRGLSGLEAELAVLEETALAQGFPGYHAV